jgi:hypothetical protein
MLILRSESMNPISTVVLPLSRTSMRIYHVLTGCRSFTICSVLSKILLNYRLGTVLHIPCATLLISLLRLTRAYLNTRRVLRVLYSGLKNGLHSKNEMVRMEVLGDITYSVEQCQRIPSLQEMRLLLEGGDEKQKYPPYPGP